MKKVIATMLLAAASAMAVSANRIGPVSTYGELKAAKINNKGQLVGSCPSYASTPVQVKGMSLFWSSAADSSTVFYSEKAVNRMVSEMNIEVIRFAMGVTEEKFKDQGRGYLSTGEGKYSAGEVGKTLQLGYLKNVVNAAIENDIYVIIDWHIESADGSTNGAKEFFEYAAKEYGEYNNVIFEVWNEPTGSMDAVKTHANTIIPIIRQYSDNLVLVGSPGWSSQPDACASAGIQDSKNNFACTLHFYAGTHTVGGGYDNAAMTAINAGVPVFASEWGTVNANGNGGAQRDPSQAWIDWMDTNKVSWANWSASAINEGSAAFKNLAIDNGLTYTESGNMVKGWMNGKNGYKDCGLTNGNASSNSGFSTGVANGAKTDLIDDLEDGDRYGYAGGYWYGFADSDDDTDGKGGTSVTNKKWTTDNGSEKYDVLLPSDGGKNTSKYMAGLKGIKLSQGGYKYAPYVAIGLNVLAEPDTYTDNKGKTVQTTKPFDMSKCTSISYKFKGASHNFRVETAGVVNYNFHNVNKDDSEDWKEVELTWDQFTQDSWGDDAEHYALDNAKGMKQLRAFAWQVRGALDVPDNMNQPKYDYLYVDDVRCNGVSITAISGNASPTSSSSKVNSSSSIGPNQSSSSLNPINSSSSLIPGLSSSSIVPIQSSSSIDTTPNKVVLIIDDVGDGDHIANTQGVWYAYNDSVPGGKSSITNVYDPILGGYIVNFDGSVDPTNGTNGFVGINGIVWNQADYAEAPFVALGLNLNPDTTLGVDLRGCEAISYRYKGAAHKFKIQDGQVTDFAYHEVKNIDAENWTQVIYTWDKLIQPVWAKDTITLNKESIKKMAWEVVGYKGFDEQPNFNFLYVDDLTCMVYDPTVSIRSVRSVQNNIMLGMNGNLLSVANAKSSMKVQIFDATGHVVYNSVKNSGSHQISLESLSKGNYIVRIVSGSETRNARISVK